MIKLFIIDDSAIVRTTISSLFQNHTDIEIVGTAQDPIYALDKFNKQGWPDVIILDIEMPRMDGLTFLKQIMSTRPTPVIICSTLTSDGSSAAMEALSYGAVEILHKPKLQVANYFEEVYEKFSRAIRAASKSKLKAIKITPNKNEKKHPTNEMLIEKNKNAMYINGENFVVIGSSTGGVQTLEKILIDLDEDSLPIVIVQHMPSGFTASFASRLNKICRPNVKEAQNGDKLYKGWIYIAPGDFHTMVKRNGNGYFLEIKDGPKITRHKPSVDVLFRSCANEASKNCTAFILTGMGDDGARGMKELFEKGVTTYAQDEKSSIVYGMPKAALEMGGVSQVIHLSEIAKIIRSLNE